MTHELRTPLTGIKMYADMLKEGWVKDEATRAEYVGFMAQETDRLARLVNRVRDFGPFIDEKGFTLEVDLEDHRPVLADADAIKQILLNLLENAVKYARDAKDRRITVTTGARPGREGNPLFLREKGPFKERISGFRVGPGPDPAHRG